MSGFRMYRVRHSRDSVVTRPGSRQLQTGVCRAHGAHSGNAGSYKAHLNAEKGAQCSQRYLNEAPESHGCSGVGVRGCTVQLYLTDESPLRTTLLA